MLAKISTKVLAISSVCRGRTSALRELGLIRQFAKHARKEP